ncbi:TolC family protein [Echinimonas agarilytica]|uniref:TolC family protein n=1 Tax=Echinimonas agarilytica TaxID=1215918 RepID=A0AA41WAS5_9GAMM|nr:TolC family protein [Echinimonas agarilytica]MCM2681392.1 TolC family protein [Echinimonas agarilytica]
MNKRFGLLSLVLVLAACSNTTNPSPSTALPEAHQATPNQWRQLPLMKQSAAQQLLVLPQELSRTIEQELSNSPDLEADLARFAIAQANYETAQAQRWPELDFKMDGGENQFLDEGNKKSRHSYSAQFRVSWEADVWGKLSDLEKASEADMDAVLMDYQSAQQVAVSQLLLSYFDMSQANRLIELTLHNQRSQQRRVAMTESRLDAGLLSSHDLRLAKNSLYTIEATLVQHRLNFHRAKQRFNVLLGRHSEADLNLALEAFELPPLELTISPSTVLQQRPDLVASESRVMSAFYRKSNADKGNLPDITVNAGLRATSQNFSDLFDWQYWLGSVTAGLVQPILDGGAIKANKSLNTARQSLALAQYKMALLNSWQEIERGIYSEAELRSKHQALEQAYQQIFAAEQRLSRQYEAGLANSFELLTLQVRRINTETELTRAYYEILANRTLLVLALGERFPVQLNAPWEKKVNAS